MKRPRIRLAAVALLLLAAAAGWQGPAYGASSETSNGCLTTPDDPCLRSGRCEIQGSVWEQTVTIDRSDIFDTQGWPGLCDMVHVGLVQGDCAPPGAQHDLSVQLSPTTVAWIPTIEGSLACAGEPAPPPMAVPALGGIARASVLLALLWAGRSWSRRRSMADRRRQPR